jgi:hypothetical protein
MKIKKFKLMIVAIIFLIMIGVFSSSNIKAKMTDGVWGTSNIKVDITGSNSCPWKGQDLHKWEWRFKQNETGWQGYSDSIKSHQVFSSKKEISDKGFICQYQDCDITYNSITNCTDNICKVDKDSYNTCSGKDTSSYTFKIKKPEECEYSDCTTHPYHLYDVGCIDKNTFKCDNKYQSSSYSDKSSPNITSYLDGNLTKTTDNWKCIGVYNGGYTEKIDLESSEIRGICPEKQRLNSTFKVLIDSNRYEDRRYDDFLLSKEDLIFEINIRSPEDNVVPPAPLLPSDSEKEKYNCSFPKEFELNIRNGMWYYDRFIFLPPINVNIKKIVSSTRDLTSENILKRFYNYFISQTDKEYSDYFLTNEEIFSDLVGHGFGRHDIFLDENITIKFKFIQGEDEDDKVNLSIIDKVTGRTLKEMDLDTRKNQNENARLYEELRNKPFEKGGLKRQTNKTGPEITVAQGPAAKEFYAGLMQEIVKEVPKEIEKIKLFKEPGKKEEAFIFPKIDNNTLNNTRDFFGVVELCCGRRADSLKIEKKDIGDCPKHLINLDSRVNVKTKLEPISKAFKLNNPQTWKNWKSLMIDEKEYLSELTDGGFSILLNLDNVNYTCDESGELSDKYKCGTPKKALFMLYRWGYYYEYNGKKVNLFSEVKDQTEEQFPPEIIKNWINKLGYEERDYLLTKDEVKKISEAEVIGKGNLNDKHGKNSKIIFEYIEIELTHDNEGIKLEMKDTLNAVPYYEGEGYEIKDNMYKNKIKKETIPMTILKKEPASSALYSQIIDALVNNVYSLKDDPKLNSVDIISEDAIDIEVKTLSSFDVDDLESYLNLKKKCCNADSEVDKSRLKTQKQKEKPEKISSRDALKNVKDYIDNIEPYERTIIDLIRWKFS